MGSNICLIFKLGLCFDMLKEIILISTFVTFVILFTTFFIKNNFYIKENFENILYNFDCKNYNLLYICYTQSSYKIFLEKIVKFYIQNCKSYAKLS